MAVPRILLGALAVLAGAAAPAEQSSPLDHRAVTDADMMALATQVAQACPATVDTAAPAERDACATRLSRISALGDASIGDTIRWGGARQGDFNPAHNALTVLNALVWRKLYLSLFVFTGQHTVETLPDESKLLRLDARLRHLAPSEFPYPFWHSAEKWRSYQQTLQVGLLFKGGKLLAAYRNAKVDPDAPVVDRAWNGFWTTDDAGKLQPRTALYSYLLSAGNPYLAELDHAYKALAMDARQYECASCHNPANPVSMNPLLIFNLPSQALAGRHKIVYRLMRNEMPPGQGITDERARQHLLGLARSFERVGDEALAYEERPR